MSVLTEVERSHEMSAGDEAKNTGQDLGGKVKEATGKVTGNERLEAEGKMDQAKASVKNAADDVADVFRKE